VQYKSLKKKQPKGWLTPLFYFLGQVPPLCVRLELSFDVATPI
jgi:hypothetical protein